MFKHSKHIYDSQSKCLINQIKNWLLSSCDMTKYSIIVIWRIYKIWFLSIATTFVMTWEEVSGSQITPSTCGSIVSLVYLCNLQFIVVGTTSTHTWIRSTLTWYECIIKFAMFKGIKCANNTTYQFIYGIRCFLVL